MGKDTAEIVVKVWAVLSWLGALSSFVAGALFPLLGGLGGTGMMDVMMGDPFAGGILNPLSFFFSLLALASGVLFVFVGLGLWQHREWARITTIVLSVISLFSVGTIVFSFPVGAILSVISLFGFPSTLLFSFPVGTILSALGIWLFGFNGDVKRLFGA